MDDQSYIILAKPHTGDYYEGSRAFLRGVHPRPNVSNAAIEGFSAHIRIVFREDSYDPTTRTRRGRFYRQTDPLLIEPHRVLLDMMVIPNQVRINDREEIEFQHVYSQDTELNSTIISCKDYGVSIGVSPAQTVWRVIDAESLSDGTTLFTLKALSSFGLLPVLSTDSREIKDACEKVIDAALKHSPVSVVDVCCDSARIIVTENTGVGGELAALAKTLEQKELQMASWACLMLAKLHQRGKSSVRRKVAEKGIQLRPVVDEDAVFSVRLFGLLLMELDYAEA